MVQELINQINLFDERLRVETLKHNKFINKFRSMTRDKIYMSSYEFKEKIFTYFVNTFNQLNSNSQVLLEGNDNDTITIGKKGFGYRRYKHSKEIEDPEEFDKYILSKKDAILLAMKNSNIKRVQIKSVEFEKFMSIIYNNAREDIFIYPCEINTKIIDKEGQKYDSKTFKLLEQPRLLNNITIRFDRVGDIILKIGDIDFGVFRDMYYVSSFIDNINMINMMSILDEKFEDLCIGFEKFLFSLKNAREKMLVELQNEFGKYNMIANL